jgi:NAD(P)-dependent dehydrogenase (short-subunit alcohol dehydrogenase family)
MVDMMLKNRTALVTGGAAGIGRGIVSGLLASGARVIVHDIDKDALQALLRQTETPADLRGEVVDVADAAAVREAVQSAWETWPIDILVNNAGINIVKDPFDFSDDEFDRIIAVNVRGVWNYAQAVGRLMAERGGGSIINIASLASDLASYRRAPYVASKGAVRMLTRALALDLAERNIRVNAVGPGAVAAAGMEHNTGGLREDQAIGYTPMRRRATPGDIADAVVFLASDRSAMITGQLLMVDGGLSSGTQIGATWPLPA